LHNGKNPKFIQCQERLKSIEDQLKWYELDEMQLLVHILKYAPRQEFKFISRAADNAKFVNDLWPCDVANQDAFALGLPFVTKGKSGTRWAFQHDNQKGNTRVLHVSKLATLLALEDRDSFSSIVSSFLTMDSVVRFNIGQESKEQLLEKIYALGVLLKPSQKIPNEVNMKTIEKFMEELKEKDDNLSCYKMASLLDFACRVFILNKQNATNLRDLIGQFLHEKENMQKISSTMKRDLLFYWLDFFLQGSPESLTETSHAELLRLCRKHLPHYKTTKCLTKYEKEMPTEILKKLKIK